MNYGQRTNSGVGAVCTNDAQVTVYPSLSMLYVPAEQFREIYEPSVGLNRGTIFRELDKPFNGCGCQSAQTFGNNGGNYRR